jgi:transposase
MSGRPFRVIWHDEDTEKILKAAYQRDRDVELRSRLHGLWLLRSGWRIGLIRLPPYSPELNPAERVFEEVRR